MDYFLLRFYLSINKIKNSKNEIRKNCIKQENFFQYTRNKS